jgi:hypothetical protein
MKFISQLIQFLALALGLTVSSSYGTLFSYSYLFGDGLSVTGSLDGTQNGNFVENVSNVSVFFNGTAMPGTVFAASYDGANYVSGPVVSFDALQNNFIFADTDFAAGDQAYKSIFYMLNASVYADTALAFSDLGFASQDWPTSRESWTLKVPDGGSTIVLMGLAMIGMALARRKLSRSESDRRLFVAVGP